MTRLLNDVIIVDAFQWLTKLTNRAYKRRINRRGDKYSGHSLRVGFAVTAAEAGADIRAIATVTRHRSLTMPARYAQKAEQIKTSPHRLAGVGFKR